MENTTILIVDNEQELRQLLQLHLRRAGMKSLEAASGRDALAILEHYPVDLVILDLMMEDMNGWEVLRHMRGHASEIPVIVLSARHLDSDKIDTLELGADDYVTKPFSPGELIARIKANLRRVKSGKQQTRLTCGNLVYDRTTQELHKPSGTVVLSPIEGVMLELFMKEPGRVYTKEEIYRNVWKLDQIDGNSVTVYINFLRKKIEEDPANPQYIQTIRGVGYRIVGEA